MSLANTPGEMGSSGDAPKAEPLKVDPPMVEGSGVGVPQGGIASPRSSPGVLQPDALPSASQYDQALPIDESLDFSGLTAKEAAFCDAYIDSVNASLACRIAGYADDKSGWVMLRKPHIQEAIRLRRLRYQRVMQVVPSDCIKELVASAFSNIGDYCSWDAEGNVRFVDPATLSRIELSAIKKIRSRTVIKRSESGEDVNTTMEIELHDKLNAINKLGEFLPSLKQVAAISESKEEDARDLRSWPDELVEQVAAFIKEKTAHIVEV